ncbi:hypothetical protein [Microseira wollei]|uniref:Uncharacterized protein n=1 Tax=Microseira wollei NIES-4236 TaxID=2530354 RepID=A0AAV3X2E4_9CYAN|nr:hypothetical protein [Microseira wollei]GET36947.1 hypothetical protein MiSe_17000 [Microseira wollei NIES-4236]
MAKKKIGEVKTPSGSTPYEVYWDKDTGEVYVATEFAGKASSKDEAMRKADYYASTGRRL